jgi:hypothetical protein
MRRWQYFSKEATRHGGSPDMARKEKIAIQKDKNMEPIDNELDAAMQLLESTNRQISDLLVSLEAGPIPTAPAGAAELGDEPAVAGEESASPKAAPTAEASAKGGSAGEPSGDAAAGDPGEIGGEG